MREKMHKTISDVPIKPIKVKSEAKLSCNSRRLSRQASISNSSNEVYYGDSFVAIPFRWESQPGTPKVKLSERRPLPPLTPPPSYQCSPSASVRNSVKKHPADEANNNNTNGRILHTVLPKLNLIKKSNGQSTPSLSSSSSSSSSSSQWSSSRSVRSSPFTPNSAGYQQRRRLSFSSRKNDEDDEYESHVTRLCFGISRNSSSNIKPRDGSAPLIKLLLRESA